MTMEFSLGGEAGSLSSAGLWEEMASFPLRSDMGPAQPWNSAWSGLQMTSPAFRGTAAASSRALQKCQRNWKLYFQMLPTAFMHGDKCFCGGTFQVATLSRSPGDQGDLRPTSIFPGVRLWGAGGAVGTFPRKLQLHGGGTIFE